MKLEYMDRSLTGFDDEKEKRLLLKFDEKNIKIGSLLFAKSGKIFYEKYFGLADGGRGVDIPNSEYALSRMFSICKSFTAIAVGLLIDEGRISLTDRIVDYYEFLTEKQHKNCQVNSRGDDQVNSQGNAPYDDGVAKTTIEDMLTMRTSHMKTTYKQDLSKNWVESFFTVHSDKEPGKNFDYDTSAAHVLCALVEKITGMDMLSYIKLKVPELGLSEESYIMRDPFGVSTGGTGLMCTTRDLFRFAYMISNNGRVMSDTGDYRQVISLDFVSKAVSKIVDNSLNAKYPFQSMGYGYYFWRGENNSYFCYGMRGQFIYFLPDKELIFIVTSDCSESEGGEQALLDSLLDEF